MECSQKEARGTLIVRLAYIGLIVTKIEVADIPDIYPSYTTVESGSSRGQIEGQTSYISTPTATP